MSGKQKPLSSKQRAKAIQLIKEIQALNENIEATETELKNQESIAQEYSLSTDKNIDRL